MQRLAAALASTALTGAVAACGAPDHGAPRHIVAPAASPLGFHRTMASLEEVRGAVAPRPGTALPARASRSRARARPPVAAPPSGDVWAALARCESGMRNDTGAPYYGFFQFSVGTWRSLGFAGLPSDHDYGTQLSAAQRLVARSGWGQFPGCARRLGLR
ncbi:MAG TPA: transglycosylase family protein [Acidimicrobiales bacterium]|nr:transglycosylase family protein [Acidimicrobiales bacterium]